MKMDSRVLRTEFENMKNLDSSLEESIGMCVETVSELVAESRNVISQDDVSGLEETMLELLKLQQQVQGFCDRSSDLKRLTEQDEDDLDFSGFKYADADINVARQDTRYLNFSGIVRHAFSENQNKDTVVDEDIAFSATTSIPLDPITQQQVKDPVRNVHCGHTYDKDSILEYIKHKRNAMCPYVGCNNKRALNKKDFILDVEVQHLIRRNN